MYIWGSLKRTNFDRIAITQLDAVDRGFRFGGIGLAVRMDFN